MQGLKQLFELATFSLLGLCCCRLSNLVSLLAWHVLQRDDAPGCALRRALALAHAPQAMISWQRSLQSIATIFIIPHDSLVILL